MAAAQTAQRPGLQVAVAGQVAESADKQSFGGTGLGVLLAGVVLLLVFGSLFAMALPLLSALASLGTAIAVIGLLSHLLKMPQFSTELVLLIGLGVGVDYALFIVTRHRQGLIAGNDIESSIVNAVNTSGRAVLFAGIIVCIALLGMFALGVSFLYGLAIAAAIGVLLHHDRRPHPASGAARVHRAAGVEPEAEAAPGAQRAPGWSGSAPRGSGRGGPISSSGAPVLPAIVALIIVVLVALPFFSLRLGTSDQGNDPTGTTTRQAYDLLARVRARLQRTAPVGGGQQPGRPTQPPSTSWPTRSQTQPNVAKAVRPGPRCPSTTARRCR